MRGPGRVLAGAAALWIFVACLDVTSPVTGIASITSVLLPSPSVVEHDTSRDTLGRVYTLRVFAFAPNGDTVRDAVVRFFAIDSTRKLRVDSLTGIAAGDSLSPFARVVARVTPANGKGIVQTVIVALPVVPTPDRVSQDTNIVFVFVQATGSTDTLAAGLISPAFGDTVRGKGDTTVQSYVVRYQIVRRPPSTNAEPTVVLSDASGHDSSLFVTDGSGHAAAHLRMRTRSIAPTLVGGATDSAFVVAHVQYRGDALQITPTDTFKIAIRRNIGP